MEIITKRLSIRNLDLEDLNDFHQYRSNPEVAKHQGYDPMSLEEAKSFIIENEDRSFGKPGEWVQYAIANKLTGRLIGDCAIKLLEEDSRMAEIGMTISDLHQGKGFAKDAMFGSLKFLFEDNLVLRVIATMSVDNTSAVKVLESIGFRREGHFIENIFFKGKWDSEYQYAMLVKEWLEINSGKNNL